MKCDRAGPRLAILAIVVTLMTSALSPSSFAQEVEPVTIVATGRGATIGEARKDSIMNALREVVGEYIESDTVMENEEIVNETITAFSNAESVTSKVIEKTFEGDDIVVTAEVTIVPAQIVARLRDAALSAVNIDGESLAAELEANQDNIELQKTTLDRIFKGLAPRLLVARLVDRKGNPITNGRPPKDDIKMSGDEVLIALNVQIYYDLAAYYEKVYPNLERVLRAVALKSLPAEVQSAPLADRHSSVYEQAFTGYPAAASEWSARSTALGMVEPMIPMGMPMQIKLHPQHFAVLLSRSRDLHGLQEGFDAFILPIELAPSIIRWNHGCTGDCRSRKLSSFNPRMRVVFESSSGDVLSRKEFFLARIGKQMPGGGDREPIPFAEPSSFHDEEQLQTWLFHKLKGLGPGGSSAKYDKLFEYGFNSTPLLIAPRFSWGNTGTKIFSDSILVRGYVSLPKQDFEKLDLIRFDFWDPRVGD
jgi:hypothetical protein